MNRKIKAVFIKQWKDTIKNPSIITTFVIFPILAVVLNATIGQQEGMAMENYFASMFATMFVAMVPISTMMTIIGEEKEKKTLKALLVANVKAKDYLIAIGLYEICLSAIGIATFAIIAKYSMSELLSYVVIMLLGIVTAIILSAWVAIAAKNQSTAISLSIPISMVFMMMPILGDSSDFCKRIADVLFTSRIREMIAIPSFDNFTFENMAVILGNMLVFTVLFIWTYKKNGLKD